MFTGSGYPEKPSREGIIRLVDGIADPLLVPGCVMEFLEDP